MAFQRQHPGLLRGMLRRHRGASRAFQASQNRAIRPVVARAAGHQCVNAIDPAHKQVNFMGFYAMMSVWEKKTQARNF